MQSYGLENISFGVECILKLNLSIILQTIGFLADHFDLWMLDAFSRV